MLLEYEPWSLFSNYKLGLQSYQGTWSDPRSSAWCHIQKSHFLVLGTSLQFFGIDFKPKTFWCGKLAITSRKTIYRPYLSLKQPHLAQNRGANAIPDSPRTNSNLKYVDLVKFIWNHRYMILLTCYYRNVYKIATLKKTHSDWSNPVHYNSTMHAAYVTRVHYISTYARNLRQQWFCSLRNLTKFHGDMFSGMFNSCTIHSVLINLNRAQDAKKVNCLNFKKFFQPCISLLEMISILVDSFHWLSSKFWTNRI